MLHNISPRRCRKDIWRKLKVDHLSYFLSEDRPESASAAREIFFFSNNNPFALNFAFVKPNLICICMFAMIEFDEIFTC
ncbi:hypothetical protein WS75_22800 [Burkholderia sp. FL-7-2-10-S1-D7]|nr:hypothetical protein WS75_22800 [Burkholderia sp. FL-7-2-10-S1-D7]